MHLMLRPHEFSSDAGLVPVRAGQTIAQMLREAAGTDDIVAVRVTVNGHEIPAEWIGKVRPKPGSVIRVTPQVLHGGSARQWLAAIAMIVLSVYAPGLGNAAAAAWGGNGAIWGAAFMAVGSLAINALVKPPMPGQGAGGEQMDRWYALTGTQNNINPWGVIPCVIGQMRFFPPHAALPFSRSAGTASYHYYMFDLGYGDLTVSDIRIGDTAIDEFDDVEWEVTKTPTLYRDDVNELAVGVTLEDTGNATRTTAPNIEEISLDLLFQAGLFSLASDGSFVPANVLFNIEYRLVGAPTWTQLTARQLDSPKQGRVAIGYIGPITWDARPELRASPYFCRRDDRKPFTAAVTWSVPPGQYEVRVTRALSEWGGLESSRAGVQTIWTVLRSLRRNNPSTTGTTKLCMRIRSTDQINGVLQTVNLLGEQKIPVYDRGTDTWSAPTESVNPAWCVWWLMTQCPAVGTHAPLTRMDLESFADYAEFCTEHGLECRYVADSSSTMRDTINLLLAASLGSLGSRDGRYCVVYDHGETLPTMTFTPLEMREFRFSRVFSRLPHALRVQYVNVEAGWVDDEVIVLDDGYSHRGVDARGAASSSPAPTRFETIRLDQAMSAQQAWQLGRFHLAQAKFRPSVYEWESDIAGLGVSRGDVVEVAHDVAEWGAGWGRVVSLTAGGIMGAAATIVLDQPVETDGARLYAAQIRRADGTREVVNIVVAGGETATFALAAMPAAVAPGDAVVIGEREAVTNTLLVTGVSYERDLVTRFRAVEYDARVAPYWADPPENIISEVSGIDYTPPPPQITVVVSTDLTDERDDAGIRRPSVNIGARDPGLGYIHVDRRLV